ncbi:MAG: hypothetical protein FWF60_03785 [Oscillospiraceae bacterium]|nr:hypothetical protein [Oscillospiraceae bacterium]
MQQSVYIQNLVNAVVGNSEAKDWQSAVTEWHIVDVEEDLTLSESCICGHPNLRYLFTIQNTINGRFLFPIGSECIKKFERPELNEEAKVMEQLFKLLHAIEENQFLTLSRELFSRKLLLYLHELGAFKPTRHNQYNPFNDYSFMLDMFNLGDRRSENQEKRTVAIILNSIKPFLQDMLRGKVRRNI